jgi:hypothetical protein
MLQLLYNYALLLCICSLDWDSYGFGETILDHNYQPAL